MNMVALGNTGITSSRLGFGCAQIMRIGSAAMRARLLETAFDAGICHFDVARMYGLGAAEGELGKFARGRRDRIVLATKFGIDVNTSVKRAAFLQSTARRLVAAFPALRSLARRGGGALVQPHDFSADKARSSLETSLRELGTDYVDMFFLHEPSLQDEITADVVTYLEKARSSGLIRAFGISGSFQVILELSQRFPSLTTVMQFPNDPFTRLLQETGGTSRCAVLTYSPFSNALPKISSYFESNQDAMRRWSERLGIDCSRSENIATLLLQYSLQANSEGTVIFSSTKPHRISELAGTVADCMQTAATNKALCDLADEILAYRSNLAGAG
jgi:D-threo-aldose 1-dehydrogenase